MSKRPCLLFVTQTARYPEPSTKSEVYEKSIQGSVCLARMSADLTFATRGRQISTLTLLPSSPSTVLLACSSVPHHSLSKSYPVVLCPTITMAMEMEGVMLSSISNPSPDEIANQINTLQTNLEDLETSRADLYAEVRSISTAASIGTVQRHFVVYLGEVAKCLKKAQK